MFLRWPFIHWRKFEIDKCCLFLTAEVALKGFNFLHLLPERNWRITDLVFNSIPKSLTQQKVKMIGQTAGLFRVKRRGWSGESPSPAVRSSPGASQKHRDPRTVAVKLTLTREKPWAGPGSYGGGHGTDPFGVLWTGSYPVLLPVVGPGEPLSPQTFCCSGDSENETFIWVL